MVRGQVDDDDYDEFEEAVGETVDKANTARIRKYVEFLGRLFSIQLAYACQGRSQAIRRVGSLRT